MSTPIVTNSQMTALDSYQRTRKNIQELVNAKRQELYDLIIKKISNAEQNCDYKIEINECDMKKDSILEKYPKIINTVFNVLGTSGYQWKYVNGRYTISWYRPVGYEYIPGGEKYKQSEDKIKELSEIDL